jgi:hypothetical protein
MLATCLTHLDASRRHGRAPVSSWRLEPAVHANGLTGDAGDMTPHRHGRCCNQHGPGSVASTQCCASSEWITQYLVVLQNIRLHGTSRVAVHCCFQSVVSPRLGISLLAASRIAGHCTRQSPLTWIGDQPPRYLSCCRPLFSSVSCLPWIRDQPPRYRSYCRPLFSSVSSLPWIRDQTPRYRSYCRPLFCSVCCLPWTGDQPPRCLVLTAIVLFSPLSPLDWGSASSLPLLLLSSVLFSVLSPLH